ncbi:MAG: transglutaminase-like domain-containing protein [Planctomycetota bacterium]
MQVPSPTYCRPEAFELFAESVERLDSNYGLLMAAVAISMHELPDVDVAGVDSALQNITDTVRERAPSGSEPALLAHAHAVLFDELGFGGDDHVFGDPGSSYLPLVLRRRRGLPIALSMIYKVVLDRLGIVVEGINAPGHFLVSVREHGKQILVDPFHRGRVLSRAEALERVSVATGRCPQPGDHLLVPATHRDWIRRVLRNLHSLFLQRRQRDRLGAMLELARLLD